MGGREEEELKHDKTELQCLVSGSLEAEPEARIWAWVIY